MEDTMLATKPESQTREMVRVREFPMSGAEQKFVQFVDRDFSEFNASLVSKVSQTAGEVYAALSQASEREEDHNILRAFARDVELEVLKHPEAGSVAYFNIQIRSVDAEAEHNAAPQVGTGITRLMILPRDSTTGPRENLNAQDARGICEEWQQYTHVAVTVSPAPIADNIDGDQENKLLTDQQIKQLQLIQSRMIAELQVAMLSQSFEAHGSLAATMGHLRGLGTQLAAMKQVAQGSKIEMAQASQAIRQQTRALADSIKQDVAKGGMPPKLSRALAAGLKELRATGVMAEKIAPKTAATPRAGAPAPILGKTATFAGLQQSKNIPSPATKSVSTLTGAKLSMAQGAKAATTSSASAAKTLGKASIATILNFAGRSQPSVAAPTKSGPSTATTIAATATPAAASPAKASISAPAATASATTTPPATTPTAAHTPQGEKIQNAQPQALIQSQATVTVSAPEAAQTTATITTPQAQAPGATQAQNTATVVQLQTQPKSATTTAFADAGRSINQGQQVQSRGDNVVQLNAARAASVQTPAATENGSTATATQAAPIATVKADAVTPITSVAQAAETKAPPTAPDAKAANANNVVVEAKAPTQSKPVEIKSDLTKPTEAKVEQVENKKAVEIAKEAKVEVPATKEPTGKEVAANGKEPEDVKEKFPEAAKTACQKCGACSDGKGCSAIANMLANMAKDLPPPRLRM